MDLFGWLLQDRRDAVFVSIKSSEREGDLLLTTGNSDQAQVNRVRGLTEQPREADA